MEDRGLTGFGYKKLQIALLPESLYSKHLRWIIAFGFAVRRKTEKPANQNASGTAGRKRLVAYLDAIGEIDGMHCLVHWKTTTSRYSVEPAGLLSLDPQLICLFLDQWDFRGSPSRLRAEACSRDSIFESVDLPRTATRFGRLVERTIGRYSTQISCAK